MTADERESEVARLGGELDSTTDELEGLSVQVQAMTDAHLLNQSRIQELESVKREHLVEISNYKILAQREITLRHQLAQSEHDNKQLNIKAQHLESKIQDLETQQSSLQTELDDKTIKLVMEEEARREDVQRLESKCVDFQSEVTNAHQVVNAFRVLMHHQKSAAELVHSVLDRVPQDTVGIALAPQLNSDGFPVIIMIDQYGSAAMSLEVHVGDVLVIVDGVSTFECPVADVRKLLEGPIGTHVIIQARHPNEDADPYVVSLARGAQNYSLSTSRPGDQSDGAEVIFMFCKPPLLILTSGCP